MKGARTIAKWGFICLVSVAILGCIGAKLYLSSSHARSTAANKLTNTLGVPVEVEMLDIGMTATKASIRIPDKSASVSADILRIGSITTDVSIFNLIGGSANPSDIQASDVELRLRIDEEGKLLSSLPRSSGSKGGTALPRVDITGGIIRILQSGKPEFLLTNVSITLNHSGSRYTVNGKIDDPRWGKWTISGDIGEEVNEGHIELATDRGQLKDPLLRSIPYVPLEVWEHLDASGETPARVKFTFKPDTDLAYAVELRPTGEAAVTIPDADVAVTHVKGLITIANGEVVVENGNVALAKGQVDLNGKYIFNQPVPNLTMKVAATGVDISLLPPSWGLPMELTGQIKGTADMRIDIQPDGKLQTSGQAMGRVENAKFAGLDAEISLRLGSSGRRFRLETMPAD